jgi:hypothetical protein
MFLAYSGLLMVINGDQKGHAPGPPDDAVADPVGESDPGSRVLALP